MSQAFAGIRILDFTRYLAGPYGTHQFALQGADVIKIESLDGDDSRTLTIDRQLADQRMSPTFMATNSNKRSLSLDLRRPEAVAIVKQLVVSADIVWENFRPGVMHKFGLDHAALAEINPALIYCSVSGFGHSGPEQFTPAFDGKIQAMSGLMSMTGDPASGPMRAGFAVCDQIGGMTAAFAVSAALFQRSRSGQGQFIDVSMLDAALSFMSPQVAEYTVTGLKQRQFGNLSSSRKVTAHRFRAGGGDIILAVLTERQFANLMRTIERPDVLSDARFADWFSRAEHESALRLIIETAMHSHDPDYWVERLTKADVPCATILSIEQIVKHPQLEHRKLLQKIESPSLGRQTLVGAGFAFAHDDGGIHSAPPRLGEHTISVLRETGYDDETIAQWRANGVIAAG